MANSRSYLDIALASIEVFTDDGKLDLEELNFLLGLALRDNVVDDDEKRVLANVFRRAEQGELRPAVRGRIAEVRAKHGVPA
ncbi:MAG: hypothetical protein O9303_05710 [Silanimonas sp.]|jgi:hypothetical protein|uniref:hypothetical protein n=1 Tax=Silanimonas sp. TaxID=1929290 RepID=UPI0022C53CC9|nr:hypothetical protein [Silanimonas sp.]MCZ8115000.1 hypothetical protein [Silanimonas sp.]MCZ8318296.1 hypothetical protein [Silanimonas sp.]